MIGRHSSDAVARNSRQFRSLALQHCRGMIAQIKRAEQCNPGCTGDALAHATETLDALERSARSPLAIIAKDEFPSALNATTSPGV